MELLLVVGSSWLMDPVESKISTTSSLADGPPRPAAADFTATVILSTPSTLPKIVGTATDSVTKMALAPGEGQLPKTLGLEVSDFLTAENETDPAETPGMVLYPPVEAL